MIIVSGTSNQPLAQELATLANAQLAQVELTKFPNGEQRVWLQTPLKGEAVAILQSFSQPVDEHIIQFCLLADAVRHSGAKSIIAVIPWLGYSPQDKEFRKGEPISAHVVARIIEAVGINKILTVDIHSESSLNYFHQPPHHISALPLFAQHLQTRDLSNHVVVSLDKGAYESAQQLSVSLSLPLAVFTKTRDLHTGAVDLTYQSGEVSGKHAISIDDFVSTGATRIAACNILKSMGVLSYTDCITHAILADNSATLLQDSSIDQLICTNTYLVPREKQIPKLKILSIAPLLAQNLS